MKLKNDIIEKIEDDFFIKKEEVYNLIIEEIKKNNQINHPRIIRCILFLADGDFFELKHYLKTAISDPRDVMLYAEYDNNNSLDPNRIRNFNNPFGKEEII